MQHLFPVVAAKPSAPRSVKVTEVKVESLDIVWKPPKSDGGAPITKYLVETSCVDDAFCVALAVDGSTCRARVDGLKEGTSYNVRVLAENEAGVSEVAGELKKAVETPLS